ncbi:kinase-like protein [Auriscalpium vulgare]|uniref:Kinase-like protein n=1 Tax=Auriscalpium vulgare TaxID=40419 RepID=A0ACB8RG53_9AGAM|nr:kinase-like protein [Auriscalpium vulgare]
MCVSLILAPFTTPNAKWSIDQSIESPTVRRVKAMGRPVLQLTKRISSSLLSPLSPLSPSTRFPWDTPSHPLEFFRTIRTLGQGGSGTVYLIQDKITTELFALKIISKLGMDAEDVEFALREQRTLCKMRDTHNILSLKASFHDRTNFYFITAYYPGGDLFSMLEKYRGTRLKSHSIKVYAAELLLSIQLLHCNSILHRDIKPGNILIDNEGHLVLADLGLARDFNSVPPKPASNGGQAKPMTTSASHGTPEYASPEVLSGKPYSVEADLWAFGVILFELLTGRDPFAAAGDPDGPDWLYNLSKSIKEDPLVFRSSDKLDEHEMNLLKRLFEKKVECRPTLQQIKAHEFFRYIDWDAISRRVRPGQWLPQNTSEAHTSASSSKKRSSGMKLYPGQQYKSHEDPYPWFTFSTISAVSAPDSTTTRPTPCDTSSDSSSSSSFQSGNFTDATSLESNSEGKHPASKMHLKRAWLRIRGQHQQ